MTETTLPADTPARPARLGLLRTFVGARLLDVGIRSLGLGDHLGDVDFSQ